MGRWGMSELQLGGKYVLVLVINSAEELLMKDIAWTVDTHHITGCYEDTFRGC